MITIDSISKFSDAIARAGLGDPGAIIADGEIHRFRTEQDKNGSKSGWYVLYDDNVPAGSFGSWKAGFTETWCSKERDSLSPAERANLSRMLDQARQRRDEARQADWQQAATRAQNIWTRLQPAPADHPYLVRKGIDPHGARIDGNGALVVPVSDGDHLMSLQFIKPDGDKRFLPDGRMSGCWCEITGTQAAPLLIAEGFATAATLTERTGATCIVAFNAGNLLPVAQAIRAKHLNADIIICGDNDQFTEGNPGETKARAAAVAIGAKLLIPDFTGMDISTKPTDWNDFFTLALEADAHALLGKTAAPEWPDPKPIPSALLPVAEFDFALLPDSLRPWVQDIADRMQCPPDYPAIGVVVALSSVVGRKCVIQPKRFDDWQVVPNLWGMVVGRPGLMKSPALAAALNPLDRLQAQARDEHRQAKSDYEQDEKFRAMAQKETEAKAAKAIKAGNPGEARQLLSAAAAEASLDAPPPALRRYKVTDSSVEALGEILMENPWGTLAYRDELHGLLRSMDKDGQEGARAFYLQGYDGNQSYTTDRILRGKNLHIDAVCIAMLGGIQPGKLRGYIRDAVTESSADDGLLQRFGLLVWPDTPRDWVNVDRWPDTEAKTTAFETFARLDALPPGTDKESRESPRVHRFSDAAQALFDEWRSEFERLLRSETLHPAMESHLAKYRKLVPALALLSALADQSEEVGEQDLLRALAWSDYLRTHAERAYAAGQGMDFQPSEALLAKVRAGKVPDHFTPRDIYLKGWAHLGDSSIVTSACNTLADLDHLRREETRKPSGGRPSVSYRINPKTRRTGQ